MKKLEIQRQTLTTDKHIHNLAYQLYNPKPEEITIIEESAK